MSQLPPYFRAHVARALTKARAASTREELAFHVRDAGNLIKAQLRDSEQELAKVMQIQVSRRKELLALLTRLNELTADKIESLQ